MWGKTSGKVGGLVYATSGGEQIIREYNPNVSNPSTVNQINQRARLKLMSQLSACLAPVVAMTKDGLVSKRNKFVKLNFDNSYATQGTAQISYENVQLTEGSLGLPQVVAVASLVSENQVKIGLGSEPSPNIARVVYCVFEKTQESRLSLVKSYIATVKGPDTDTETPLYYVVDSQDLVSDSGQIKKEYVVYAYGMIDTNERATARYGNLQVQSASDIATLVGLRTISFEDYQFTQTRGITIGYNSGGTTPTPAGQAKVYVTALGDGGTVSGGGTFALGSQVTVTATAATGYKFRAWVKNGTSQIVSTSATYTFTLNAQVDLLATFESEGNESL